MAVFVLVHGAWHGAWCWRRVLPLLRVVGHEVHAVTLTGLGDRAHLLDDSVNLETHVADVMETVQAEELGSVVLVVHSYAGMIGTALADRMPERLQHLVYLDAVLPETGESWSESHPESTREQRLHEAKAHPNLVMTPPDPAVLGLDNVDAVWVRRRMVPHPVHTYVEPLHFNSHRVAGVRRTYVQCTQPVLRTMRLAHKRSVDPAFWGGEWFRDVQLVELFAGHDAMVSAPREVANVLLAAAA